MNKHVEQITRNTQKILNFLEKGHMSDDNYIGSDMPFFMKNDNDTFTIGHHNLPEMPNGLNHDIVKMFQIIGNPQREVYINDWTIMSLNQCIQMYEMKVNNGQHMVFDIGYIYAGMGHVRMLSCDLKTGKLFTRIDGGGDDYVRELYFKEILNFDRNNYEYFDFDKFMEMTNV